MMSSESKTEADDAQQQLAYPRVFLHNGKLYPFNPHNVIYADPKPNSHGGLVIKCTYPISVVSEDGTKPVVVETPMSLQTPVMSTAFGMSSKEHDGKLVTKVDVVFEEGASADVRAFEEVMKLWDRLILAKAKKMKASWFKSAKITDDILDYLYIPMCRSNESKDGVVYPDSFRTKVQQTKGGVKLCEVFDVHRKPATLSSVTPRCTLRKQCEQTGIWFTDKMFVSAFSVRQIQVITPGRSADYGFAETQDEDMPQASEV